MDGALATITTLLLAASAATLSSTPVRARRATGGVLGRHRLERTLRAHAGLPAWAPTRGCKRLYYG
jgi:hypothetical protein